MLGVTLPTDQANEAEWAEFRIGLAVNIYRERLSQGAGKSRARMEAINYLRRKTGWSLAITAGALDTAILERDIVEALEQTEELEGFANTADGGRNQSL